MAHATNRTGLEEKGQRNVRSLDVYRPKRGLPEGAMCKGCGIVYHNKRWQTESTQGGSKVEVVCPACQRMEDHNPAGVVTLSGPYLASHKEEILNAIKAGGATFLGLDVRKPNLEEVFLKLTGETLHEDPAGERGAE